MKRPLYFTLYALEILAIVALILLMILPIQDFSLREYLEWQTHPSQQTYQAFVESQRLERGARLLMAVPVIAVIALLGGVLSKYRGK